MKGRGGKASKVKAKSSRGRTPAYNLTVYYAARMDTAIELLRQNVADLDKRGPLAPDVQEWRDEMAQAAEGLDGLMLRPIHMRAYRQLRAAIYANERRVK